MLELKNITKKYKTGDFEQKALDNLSVNFRGNEFVSILGPSGSGKTTLLNIIGGLDQYTSGDLIINEVSTKKYTDRSWDTYRNHRIGFVFQSYNLITHQSILSNVELALTLSGVSSSERKKRAKEALIKVGLKDHINKRPNQLSGGQMQRVAIARALVNNPDILLADEPTGALDSETSEQIMDILKKIAKNKLVVMVTHNPELAEKYSTRIVKLLDGKIINDTKPYDGSTISDKDSSKDKKTSMSFLTALSLSLNNLLTKKGRTILTAFAGSIGIIGIALILSLSTGVQNYINKVQEDTLTSYPLSIEDTTADISTMLGSLMQNSSTKHGKDKVYANNIMTSMMSSMTEQIKSNDLKEFKTFLDSKKGYLSTYVNDIKYAYDLKLQIYSNDGNYSKINPSTIMSMFGGSDAENSSPMSGGIMMNQAEIWKELSSNTKLLKSQYDVLAGKMPESHDEVVLIIDKNHEISDYALYALGIKDQSEIIEMTKKIMMGEKFEAKETSYTYDEILDSTFKLINNTDYYKKEDGIWVSKSGDAKFMKEIIDNSLTLKIVGVMKVRDDANISSTTGEIGYLSSLSKYVIDNVNESKIAKEQIENKEINVFTGDKFTGLESYENNTSTLGIVDLDKPSRINIYPKDFESKTAVEDLIKEYNEGKSEEGKIAYTDYVGLLMNSVTKFVDIVSYVLIAFVSISLFVSSIMIGIITYISVLERTKEIGILRAIGASKKDIRRVFNAETFIIGLAAGSFGIIFTALLNIPVNMIIKNIAGVEGISSLPIVGAIILIIISIILTTIAGWMPANMASKKDPVEALRTE